MNIVHNNRLNLPRGNLVFPGMDYIRDYWIFNPLQIWWESSADSLTPTLTAGRFPIKIEYKYQETPWELGK